MGWFEGEEGAFYACLLALDMLMPMRWPMRSDDGLVLPAAGRRDHFVTLLAVVAVGGITLILPT
jgi:hypothetical protein